MSYLGDESGERWCEDQYQCEAQTWNQNGFWGEYITLK